MPKISVIIPVYRAEKFLANCLDSVLAQTFTDIEIICIDDGNTDSSPKILAKYAARDIRIKVITNKKNMGVSNARNNGIKIATGKYIHFMDADDFLDSDYYEKMYENIVRIHADMACSGFVSDTKYTSGIKYKHQILLKTIKQKVKKTNVLTDGYIWRYLFKKSFLDKNKLLFDVSLISQEDIVFLLQCFNRANAIVIVPDTLYHYVLNTDSALHRRDSAHYKKLKENYKIGKEYRKKFARENGLMLYWKMRKIRKLFKI